MKNIKLKNHLFYSFFLLISININAQTRLVRNLERIETVKFEVSAVPNSLILVPMKFNEAITKDKFKDIPIERIESISLVYTKFKLSETFSQAKLNNDRLVKLNSEIPGIRMNKNIKWYWVAQTGCASPVACKSYFHGFVIQLRNKVDSAATKMEGELLKYYVDMYAGVESTSEYMDSIAAELGSSVIKRCDTSQYIIRDRTRRESKFKAKSDKSSKKLARLLNKYVAKDVSQITITHNRRNKLSSIEGVEAKYERKVYSLITQHFYLRSGRYKSKRSASKFILVFERNAESKIRSLVLSTHLVNDKGEAYPDFKNTEMVKEKVACYYIDTALKMGNSLVYDDVVTRVFERHKEWNNALIATDVTGSMSPFVAQFLMWHKLKASKSNKVFSYVFFNDGDNKPDMLKRAGHVGGLYYAKTKSYKEIDARVNTAMLNGGGGDGPENNIEAVIYGLKMNPNVREVIMIADNWATPRDLKLLDKVNKPIRLILCGASGGINIEYLNMIRVNGGSVHTMEEDLVKLAEVKEGEMLKIGTVNYTVRAGRFVRG